MTATRSLAAILAAWALGFQGYARAFGDRPREAICSLETAKRLSPFDPMLPYWQHFLSRAYYWMGDYQAAIAVARQVGQTYPNFQSVYRALVAALGQIGQASEARRVMAEEVERFGDDFRSGYTGAETRPEDREHLMEGYRKAGVLD